jgi:hypothetical protein
MVTLLAELPEAELQENIIKIARDCGWLAYATYRSYRSEPGFPDLVLVRPPSVIFAEVKTQKGRIRKGKWNAARSRWLPGQDDWATGLERCPGVEYFLVRPANYYEFTDRLMQQ